MSKPILLKSYKSDMYLLLEYRMGRTPVSSFTVSVRQIDGTHVQAMLLAKEDLEEILRLGEMPDDAANVLDKLRANMLS